MAVRCEMSNGELLGGVIVCRDITEIKKEEILPVRSKPRSGNDRSERFASRDPDKSCSLMEGASRRDALFHPGPERRWHSRASRRGSEFAGGLRQSRQRRADRAA